jgi:hypothetical protein
MQKRLLGTILMASALLACSGGENQEQTSGTGTSNGVCDAGEICFDVVKVPPGMTIEAGRLWIVWVPLGSGGNPLLAYDVAFDPAVTKLEIPIADIALPTPELLYCERACDDEAMCPCISEFGFGTLVVGADTDGDGRLDSRYTRNGGGAILVYSQKEYMPAPEFLAGIEGIAKGVRAYVREDGDDSRLRPSAPGTWLPLNICPSDQAACRTPE